MHPFQRAVEVRDIAAIEDSLADDVVFTSPNTFRPYRGKSITAAFLRAVLRVLDDFRYVRQITDGEGHDHAFVFEARIGDVAVSGCDLVHVDGDGKIDDLVVMVRPLSAANALQVAMGAEMERIQHEATMTAGSDRKDA
ncbi:nuclear transport factor 2 family protein [Mycolicibacterium sp. 050158]|uniref:nuclear transport factor 2 family protein n=1 Tax=Mycolicibacterium sp. 050158 TaxID=3090602 RepID=UPI00299DA9B8|nr:nuclear transport factor 2 family protein [Mycolicibacterium sp. 050158]MDX1893099.1 nuclear transport factor 2 family protein [Mycolicibacterium sp. 050158]